MIEAKNISYNYANKDIFENASCKLPSNGVILLLGDNGVGKTTFFKLIMGELKLKKGYIKINNILINENVSKKNLDLIKDNVAYVSQKDDFIDFLNAQENANIKNLLEHKKNSKLSLLDNDIYNKKNKNQLSNGEKVMISLQRAINDDKKIILLDEATDFLDNKNTHKIIKIIKKMAMDKLIVIISHDERVIKEFDKKIIIDEKKITQNFCFNYSINEIPSFSASRKSIFQISKKLLKKNFLVLFLSILLFTLFNSITLFGFNTITYSFDESIKQAISEGYYSYTKEYNDVYIDNINLSNTLKSNSLLSKNDLELIDQNFIIDYCQKFGILISKKIQSNGKIRITNDVYTKALKQGKIEDEKIKIHIYYYNAYLFLPFEILDEEFFIDGYDMMINYDDFKTLSCDSPISISCALWENEKIKYNNKDQLLDFFTNKSKIAFISPSTYEKKYNVKLTKIINENEIYISKYLSKYFTSSNLKFFDFKNYDLGKYDTSIIDLNDVFPNDTKICFQNDICDFLTSNEVLISEKSIELINKFVFDYTEPLIYVNDSNKDNYIYFLINNDLKVVEVASVDSKYSLHHLYLWERELKNDLWFWIIIYSFIFILDKCIICIYSFSYKKSNINNIRVMNNYLSNNKNIVLFSLPFLIGECVSIFFSFFIGKLLIEFFYESLKYNIPFIKYNIYGLFLSVIIISLDFILFYLILKNKKDIFI